MRAAIDCGETYVRDVMEKIVVRNSFGGKPGSHGSKAIQLNPMQGVDPSP